MDIDFDFDTFFCAPEQIPQYVLKVHECDIYESVLTILPVFSLRLFYEYKPLHLPSTPDICHFFYTDKTFGE